MADVASRDLRNHTAEVLRRVTSGERVTTTSRGRPVAEMTPIRGGRRRPIQAGELARRLATLANASHIEILVVDGSVAAEWARMRVHPVQTGRRVNVNDLWIAATAVTHGLPVVGRDDELDPLLGVAGLQVIKV